MSACPINGCAGCVRSGHLLCLYHWNCTPIALRREVNRTWAAFRNAIAVEQSMNLLAEAEYEAARAKALEHVNAAQAPAILE